MKQFGTILSFELKYYLKNKVFVGSTIVLVVLIAAVMCFPRVMGMFESGENTDAPAELPIMLVKTGDPADAEMVQEIFAASFDGYNVQVTEAEIESVREQIISGAAECAFVMTTPTTFTYYVNNLSMYDMNTSVAGEVLGQIYQMNAMMKNGMSAA